jgi:spoIIIJ-associated protein
MSATLFSGKTVEDAIAEGLRVLGLRQSEVDVEVVSRGSRGLFGIGSEPAQVRLTPRQQTAPPVAPQNPPGAVAVEIPPAPATPAPTPVAPPAPATPVAPAVAVTPAAVAPPVQAQEVPADDSRSHAADEDAGNADTDALLDVTAEDEEMAAMAVDLLKETVRLMGFDAAVDPTWHAPDEDNKDAYLLIELHGRDLGALIGRRGETLNSLQYLLRLMVNQRIHAWRNIVVDVENYRLRRAEHLTQLALRSADQVASTGRPLSLEPMPPGERRIIHIALRDHPAVFTESSGEGERRKIQIVPKRP